jgi:hypothetical protein
VHQCCASRQRAPCCLTPAARSPPPSPSHHTQGAGTAFGTEPAGTSTYGSGAPAAAAAQVYRDPPLGASTFEPFHHPVGWCGAGHLACRACLR